jgi:hypothetical protein
MGTYSKGIIGAFSGKVGPVVGATWRGKDVMRSLPRKSTKPATQTQKLQREKFTMVTAFLAPINPIVKRYFGNDIGIKTRRNQAMSHLIKEAITYVDPNLVWEYNKVLISRGELLGINEADVATGAGQSINITWTDNSGNGDALATDKLVVVVYEPTTKTTVYSLDAATRNLEVANITLPAYCSGLSVEVWATFAATDEKMWATSQYLGTVLVA